MKNLGVAWAIGLTMAAVGSAAGQSEMQPV
jgi:hypothetical protein